MTRCDADVVGFAVQAQGEGETSHCEHVEDKALSGEWANGGACTAFPPAQDVAGALGNSWHYYTLDCQCGAAFEFDKAGTTAVAGAADGTKARACGNAAGEAACITACATLILPVCLADSCYGPNGPDFKCGAKFEPFGPPGGTCCGCKGQMGGYDCANPPFCKTLVPTHSAFCPHIKGGKVGHCKDGDTECITCCKKVMTQLYAGTATAAMGL